MISTKSEQAQTSYGEGVTGTIIKSDTLIAAATNFED
jgi:hypothetical protein